MKTFGLPPTSPLVKKMNEYQWAWCFANLAKDSEEDDNLFRIRAKYHAIFINPDAVRQVNEEEIKQGKGGTIPNGNKKEVLSEDSIDASDAFMAELEAALNGEQFMELPNENDIRGNAGMSSEEFEAMCLAEFEKSELEINGIPSLPDDGLDYIFVEDDDNN